MKKKTIGRTLKQDLTETLKLEKNNSKVLTLNSGRTSTFTLTTVPNNKLKDSTFVELEVNGRDQSQLTAESLSDLSTIKVQQFFPAIAIKNKKDGKLNILDGSRRRAAAILFNADLEVLISDDDISINDARQLAKDIQTAREHNLREVGLRLKIIQKTCQCDNKTLAKKEGLSPSKVTRALQAAEVSQLLIDMFEAAELTYPDYKFLLKVEEHLKQKNIELDEFCISLFDSVENIYHEYPDEAKSAILTVIKKKLSNTEEELKDKMVTETLKEYSKDKFIKRKTKGRTVSYELSRISKDLQKIIEAEIDKFIKDS